jgi:hypothetical protein
MDNENESLSKPSSAYPAQTVEDGATTWEIALAAILILLVCYGSFKAITYSPKVTTVVSEGTKSAVSGSLGVAVIATMLK